jgi:hypothetical protein
MSDVTTFLIQVRVFVYLGDVFPYCWDLDRLQEGRFRQGPNPQKILHSGLMYVDKILRVLNSVTLFAF